MSDSLKIAVLIDTDNISATYISVILDEVATYGTASIRRAYGDWTNPQAAKWKEELLNNSLTPMQQFGNTTGKNSTDSAMIIDAMDILYSGDVDGFCIVSSDSDFTRLASRLRESGSLVIGMGEEKTLPALRKACTKFVVLENLMGAGSEHIVPQNLLPLDKIESSIADTVVSNNGQGKRTSLSVIGSELGNKYSDFDVRNYGYSSLSQFIDDMPKFDLKREEKDYYVALKKSPSTKEEIADFIQLTLAEKPTKKISLSDLGNLVRKEFVGFDQRDFGYAQFSKFIASLDGVELSKGKGNQQNVGIKKGSRAQS